GQLDLSRMGFPLCRPWSSRHTHTLKVVSNGPGGDPVLRSNVSKGQPGFVVLFDAVQEVRLVSLHRWDAPLPDCVPGVISIGSEEEVVGPNALAVVTSVTNYQSLGDGAECHLVRDPVRSGRPYLAVHAEQPVPVGLQSTSPFPALSRPIHLFPESLFGFGRYCEFGHHLHLCRSVRECKLLGRDAFPGGDQVIDLAGAVAGATNVEADLRRLDAADIFDAAVLLHVGDGRLDGAAAFTGRTGLHGHAAFSPFASFSKRSRHLGPYRRMAASTIKSWMTRLKLLCPASRASSSAARKTSGWALMFRRSAVRLLLMCASLCFTSNQQRPRAHLTAGHSK